MINKLCISNVQAHEHSELEFVPGINCIIGSSDNGKSAILRALYWARYNRPLGSDILASHWALDKKGKILKPIEVRVEKDGHFVTRRREANANLYIVDKTELEAVKTDVPEEVEKFFALTETNIQKQQDAPFLLSQSSGDVAKYFNRIVRLDIIDKVLSKAESQRRKCKQESESMEKQINALVQELDEYNWIEDAQKLYNKWERVNSRGEATQEQYNRLQFLIDSHAAQQVVINSQAFIKQARALVEKQEVFFEKCQRLKKKEQGLSGQIKQYNDTKIIASLDFTAEKAKIKALTDIGNIINRDVVQLGFFTTTIATYKKSQQEYDFRKAKALVSKISAIDIQDNINIQTHLAASILEYKRNNEQGMAAQTVIARAKEQLPKVCPTCGAALKKDGQYE